MAARISTQPASLLPALRRWLDHVLVRWAERIDSMPMPTRHRMGSWERSVRDIPSDTPRE